MEKESGRHETHKDEAKTACVEVRAGRSVKDELRKVSRLIDGTVGKSKYWGIWSTGTAQFHQP